MKKNSPYVIIGTAKQKGEYPMVTETIVLNEERNVTLTVYLQRVGGEFPSITRRPAVLVIPGGGYRMCSDREADPVALAYLQKGYQAFILRYSVGEAAAWPNPLTDYEQAMELIRSRAGEWNLYPDKIAVVGFSAGGHLAASGAVMGRNRPNAAVLGYAVLQEETVRRYVGNAPGLIGRVDTGMCPCFLFAARTDNVVPIENTVKFLQALTEKEVPYESHIYSYGAHGFSTGDPAVLKPGQEICSRVPRWVEDSVEWLNEVLEVKF